MKKLLVLTIAIACIIALVAFNSDAASSAFKKVKRHDIWGPDCRTKCSQNKGEICGYISQGCCTLDRCSSGFSGQKCEAGYKLHIPGCTTQD